MSANSIQQGSLESQEQLRLLMDAMPALIAYIDRGLRYRFVNGQYEAWFGRKRGEILGQPVREIIGQEAMERLRPYMERALGGERVHFEAQIHFKGAGLRWVSADYVPHREASGQVAGIYLLAHDITKRSLADQALREARDRLGLAVETAQVGTYERDLLKNEVHFNEVCREILGLGEGPFPTDVAHRSLHPQDRQRVLAVVARAFDPVLREVSAAEFRIVRPDGAVRWVAGRARVVFDDTQQPVRAQKVLGVLLDITERKLAEEELLRARQELTRANAELEQRVQERTARLQEVIAELEHMSYSMVHDMRAPLRAIQSFGVLLERDPESHLSGEAREWLSKLGTAAERMDQLLTGALDYNRTVRSGLSIGPVNLRQLLGDLLAAHPELRPPQAEVLVEGDFPWVQGNEAALAQCCGELLRNGVKFVEPGRLPRVRVWAECRVQSAECKVQNAEGGTEEGGAWVRIWFEDNGTGIPASGRSRIFDMFQRMHGPEYPGTGIGLALVRKVMERMGGRVGVESEEGKGSRFWVELREEGR